MEESWALCGATKHHADPRLWPKKEAIVLSLTHILPGNGETTGLWITRELCHFLQFPPLKKKKKFKIQLVFWNSALKSWVPEGRVRDAEQLTLCKAVIRNSPLLSWDFMGCTSFRAWADAPRAWVHPHSLARSEEFVAFQCLGQILTQRFPHVIFHGRKQELFCRGSEQMRCQLLAGKYHFQPHSQAPTDVSALQSNGNFMDHFLLLLLFPGMEQQIQNALGNTAVSS